MYCFVVAISLALVCYILARLLRSLKIGNLTDKYVFITGCDSGFGRELAIHLDKLGMPVFAGCLREDAAKSLSETCSSRLNAVILDVSKTESVEAALTSVQRKLPADKGLWALVNNAGIPGTWVVTEICTKEDFIDVAHVNLFGLVDMCRLFLPLVRKSQGRIVNTASSAGRFAFIAPAYCASKYGVEAYSDCLRRQVAHQGVKVSILEPGCFKTPIFTSKMHDDAIDKLYNRASPEVKSVYPPRVIDKCKELVHQLNDNGCSNLSLVVDAYTHAITARFPKTRYVVGNDAKFIYVPLSFLPDCISDFLIIKVLNGIVK